MHWHQSHGTGSDWLSSNYWLTLYIHDCCRCKQNQISKWPTTNTNQYRVLKQVEIQKVQTFKEIQLTEMWKPEAISSSHFQHIKNFRLRLVKLGLKLFFFFTFCSLLIHTRLKEQCFKFILISSIFSTLKTLDSRMTIQWRNKIDF